MPRFFFHVFDGKAIIDNEGTELPDGDAARVEAFAIASSLLKGSEAGWPSQHGWRVMIVDERRSVVATLAFNIERSEVHGHEVTNLPSH